MSYKKWKVFSLRRSEITDQSGKDEIVPSIRAAYVSVGANLEVYILHLLPRLP